MQVTEGGTAGWKGLADARDVCYSRAIGAFIKEQAMIVWLVVAVIALIGEVMTTGLFLGSVAVAALVTAFVALAIPFVTLQILIFAGLSLFGILMIRPFAVSALGLDTVQHSGEIQERHLTGRRAVVTQTVDAHGGQIRIGHGEFWSAQLYAELEDPLLPGELVEIQYVEGLTAHVAPVIDVEDTPPQTPVSSQKGDS